MLFVYLVTATILFFLKTATEVVANCRKGIERPRICNAPEMRGGPEGRRSRAALEGLVGDRPIDSKGYISTATVE